MKNGIFFTNRKMALRIIFFAVIGLGYMTAYAQTDPGFTGTGSLGVQVTRPYFVGRPYDATGYWQGVNLQTGVMRGSLVRGLVKRTGADGTVRHTNGFIGQWGVRLGGHVFRDGRLIMNSVRAIPFVNMGVTYMRLPKDSMPSDRDLLPMSFGFHVSPGLTLRLSSIYITAQAEVHGMANWIPFMNRERRANNLGTGLMILPVVSIGIDNGWDVLAPTIFNARSSTGTLRELGSTTNMDYVRGVRTTVTTYQRTSTASAQAIYQIDPYFGVGPSFAFSPRTDHHGESRLWGLNAGGKFGMFRLDGFYRMGYLGLHNGVHVSDINQAFPNELDMNFTSYVPVSQVGGKAGINLFWFFKNMISSTNRKGSAIFGSLPFYSVFLNYQRGITQFTGPARYHFQQATNRMDAYYAAAGIAHNSSNDARQLPGKSSFQSLGVAIEMGMVSLGYENLFVKDARIANSTLYHLTVNLPLGRMASMLRLQAKTKSRLK